MFGSTETSATLIWDRVDPCGSKTPVTGYQIKLYHLDKPIRTVYLEGANITVHTLDDLPKCKHTYSVDVAPVSKSGVGTYSHIDQLGWILRTYVGVHA